MLLPLIVFSLVVFVLFVLLFMCPIPQQSLHGSSVGPNVYHKEVHDALYDQWSERVSDEMMAREAKFWRGAFGGSYPAYSNCCGGSN